MTPIRNFVVGVHRAENYLRNREGIDLSIPTR